MHSKVRCCCPYDNDPSQSQLPVHCPLWITVGWKLDWIFFSPDDPIFPSPISKENDLAPMLLEFWQRLLNCMNVVVTWRSGKVANENEQGVGWISEAATYCFLFSRIDIDDFRISREGWTKCDLIFIRRNNLHCENWTIELWAPAQQI